MSASQAMTEKACELVYMPYGVVMLRSPLLPVEMAEECLRDSASFGRLILDSPAGPAIREAILAASPDLFDALTRLEKNLAQRKERRVRAALRRYLIRMATRTTPFGLFAGVGMGRLDRQTSVRLGSRQLSRTHTQPDFEWIFAAIQELESRPSVARSLTYTSSGTVFASGERLYLPHPVGLSPVQHGDMTSLRLTPITARALEYARHGVRYNELILQLQAERPDASQEQLEGLVDHLRDVGALTSQLRPMLTGGNLVSQLLLQMRGLPDCDDVRTRLLTIKSLLETYDRTPIGHGIQQLVQLKSVATIRGENSMKAAKPAIDLRIGYEESTISSEIAEELSRGVEALARVSTASGQMQHLASYRRDFLDRYGEGREVPLLVLLDEELGLGPPATYRCPPPQRPTKSLPEVPSDLISSRTKALMELAVAAKLRRQREVVLQESDLARLQVLDTWRDQLPESIDVFASIAAQSQDAIEAGEYTLVIGPRTGDQPAGRSFGRFAELLGTEAVELLAQVTNDKRRTDSERIDAELSYIPYFGKSANIAMRPLTTPYEIVDGVRPSVDREHTIPLSDLVVGVRFGRFYLRSLRLNKEVSVRSTHLLHFMKAPNACRFIFEASQEGFTPLVPFDWSSARLLVFLPRIRVGKVVLCPAEWHLNPPIVHGARLEEARGALNEWRDEWDVPPRVMLTEADNRLLLDLDDEGSIGDLLNACSRCSEHQSVILQEVIPDIDGSWLEGKDGHYALELVIPFRKRKLSVRLSQQSIVRSSEADIRESLRLPGSDWLYAKLYAGPSRQDELLAGPVRSFVAEALGFEGIDRWFFIRYSDPEPHLRLRLHGLPKVLLTEALPGVTDWAQALVNWGVIQKLVVDTYDRETERYGGPQGIDIAEAVFGFDSEAVVEIIALERREHLEMPRTNLALLTVDDLVRSFGLTIAERHDLFHSILRGHDALEGPSFDRIRHQFHDYRKTSLSIIGNRSWLRSQKGGVAIDEQLRLRRRELQLHADRLRALEAAGELLAPLHRILASYVHMHCNRLLGVDRGAELTVMTYLYLLYEGLRRYLPPGFESD